MGDEKPRLALISPELERSLDAAGLGSVDSALVAAARRLAFLLDSRAHGSAEDAVSLGVFREFRMVLHELGLTPDARSVAGGGEVPAPAGRSALDELRARRDARTD